MQYLAFIGRTNPALAHRFVRRCRKHAVEQPWNGSRLRICRIAATSIYRAIGAEHGRHRRPAAPEVVLRRLLSRPANWSQDGDARLALAEGHDSHRYGHPSTFAPDEYLAWSDGVVDRGDDGPGSHDVLLLVVLDDKRRAGSAADPNAQHPLERRPTGSTDSA